MHEYITYIIYRIKLKYLINLYIIYYKIEFIFFCLKTLLQQQQLLLLLLQILLLILQQQQQLLLLLLQILLLILQQQQPLLLLLLQILLLLLLLLYNKLVKLYDDNRIRKFNLLFININHFRIYIIVKYFN